MKTGLMFDVLWVISFVGCCQLDDFCFVNVSIEIDCDVRVHFAESFCVTEQIGALDN